jgi:hypothetical protein
MRRSSDPLVVHVLGSGSTEGKSEVEVFCAVVELQRLQRLYCTRGYAAGVKAVRRGLDALRAEHRKRIVEEQASDAGEDDPEEVAALAEADERFRGQALEVEDEWTSEEKVALLNQPSPALLAMKRAAQRMMAANRSNDQSMIARQIAEREAEERLAAGERLAEGYQAALAQLRIQWEAERAVIRAKTHTARKKDTHPGHPQARARRPPTHATAVSHVKLVRDKVILKPFGLSKRSTL